MDTRPATALAKVSEDVPTATSDVTCPLDCAGYKPRLFDDLDALKFSRSA